MQFERSQQHASAFKFLSEVGSTNTELVARATGPDAAGWPDFSVIVTDNQTQGRGRLGRSWYAPSGKSLAISVLLRPSVGANPLPLGSYGWLPLLAGAAMTRTVRAVVTDAVGAVSGEDARIDADGSGGVVIGLKWPNDVQISGYKVSGILSELVPGPAGVVIGAGLNLALTEHELPTESATSLSLITGTEPDPDAVLAQYLQELRVLYDDFRAARGDASVGLAQSVSELCSTLGSAVRVELPGDSMLLGTAVGLDRDGRLVVRREHDDELQSVAAGDVTHLRY